MKLMLHSISKKKKISDKNDAQFEIKIMKKKLMMLCKHLLNLFINQEMIQNIYYINNKK